MTTIDGLVTFQHLRDAFDAATALEEHGYEAEIQYEMIDDYSDAGFMAVWRRVGIDAGSPNAGAATDAFWKEVQAIVAPFHGWLDCVGFDEQGSAAREMEENK
jgi:hypothetical protein